MYIFGVKNLSIRDKVTKKTLCNGDLILWCRKYCGVGRAVLPPTPRGHIFHSRGFLLSVKRQISNFIAHGLKYPCSKIALH
jgi:hypothetical protein